MSNSQDIQGAIDFTPAPNTNTPRLAGTLNISGDAAGLLRQAAGGPHEVTLRPTAVPPTPDQLLWSAIRNRTDAIAFPRYSAFIQRLLCEQQTDAQATCGGVDGPTSTGSNIGVNVGEMGTPSINDRLAELMSRPSIYGVDAYQLLKLATQAFLIFESGVVIETPRGGASGDVRRIELEEEARLGRPITLTEARAQLTQYLSTQIGTVGGRGLPYLKRVVDALLPDSQRAEGSPFCSGTLRHRLHCPAMMELLFNYWMEQGSVVQSLGAVLMRFQNRRRGRADPLVELAIDPLRGAGSLLWGRVQAEPQQLSLLRREHEYKYAYGITLRGGASVDLAPVESRDRFIEAFHDLLHEAARFYEADAVTTVRADAFGLLQRLKELHLVLAEAANNQWPEITRQAREELLIDQYLLARPEIREFLRGRAMVPALEAYMPQVDTMKRLQGWMPQVSVSHFHTLANTGEKLLLGIRFGDWTGVIDQTSAINWARYWIAEVKSYLHAYQAVTGVDLAADVTAVRGDHGRYLQPADHLRRRSLAPSSRQALVYETSMPVLHAAGPHDE
jgi:hypothetical protein